MGKQIKTRDVLLNVGIAVLIVAVIVVVLSKFVIKPSRHESFQFDDLEKLRVLDLAGNEIKLLDIVDDKKETFIMLFELRNCNSCVWDGIVTLKNFQQSGIPAKIVAVHDALADIVGWTSVENFSPVYMMRKNTFYNELKCATLPVIVKIKNRKVVSYRYILK